jgi:hypothetical protein
MKYILLVCLLFSINTVAYSAKKQPATPVPDSFFVTDGNWSRGIALNWTGFFVPNTEPFITNYKVGKFVKFANGDVREIIRTEVVGTTYLNVYVDGKQLDPEKVGLPSHFSVIKKTSHKPK